MKKILVVLCVFLVASVLFADAPGTAEFTVTTNVSSKAFIGVTTTAYSNPSASYTAFTNHPVTAAGDQTLTAYITSYSNNPAGYNIKMSATAMSTTSTSALIHYTVGVNRGNDNFITFATKAPYETTIYQSGPLSTTSGNSYPIILSVESESYNAATTGTYVGTVTFTYTAN